MLVCGCGGDGDSPMRSFARLKQPEASESASVQWAVQFLCLQAVAPGTLPLAGGFPPFLLPSPLPLTILQRSLASLLGLGGSSAQSVLPRFRSTLACGLPLWLFGFSHFGPRLFDLPVICSLRAGLPSYAAHFTAPFLSFIVATGDKGALARGLREVSVALGPPPRLHPVSAHEVSSLDGSTGAISPKGRDNRPHPLPEAQKSLPFPVAFLLMPLPSTPAHMQRSLASPLGFGGSSAQSFLLRLPSFLARGLSLWLFGFSHFGSRLSCLPDARTIFVGCQNLADHLVAIFPLFCFATGDRGVLARGLREVSVALGPPPRRHPNLAYKVLSPVGHTFLSVRDSGPAPFFKSQGFPLLPVEYLYHSRCLREISVAQGSPPANASFASWRVYALGCIAHGGSLAAALFITVAALHLLVLWRLLLQAVPGGRSPLKNLLCVPCATVPSTLVLPWGCICTPAQAKVPWKRAPRCATAGRSQIPFWLRLLMIAGTLPVPVWAVPPDFASAVTDAYATFTPDPHSSGSGSAAGLLQPSEASGDQAGHSRGTLDPDDLQDSTASGPPRDIPPSEYRRAVEADIATKGSSCCLQAQPGLCILSPGIDVSARLTLCAPGHCLVTTEIILKLPVTLEHFVDRVYEAAPTPLDHYWNKLIPAVPQLGDGAATFLVAPHWFKHAGLATVLFDARSMTGKVFAEVLPARTSLEAINKIVGPSVITPFEVFVAGGLRPLQLGQEVHLEEGDTICLAPADHLPLWGPPLLHSLQQPTPWLSMDPVPTTARALCVLLLHESGKYLFSDMTQCDWQNLLRVTHFIGVEMSESRMVSAFQLEPYVYHGTPVRGVIAVLGRSTERDSQNRPLPAVLFIDARLVGQDVNFCILAHYHVTRDFLLGYARCPPPPGYRLAVKGGQLRGDGFDFHGGEVLTLAFIPDEHGELEFGESECGGSDDPSDPSEDDPHSDESTRSRSRHRDVSASKASGDSSYYSHLPAPESSGTCQDKVCHASCSLLALIGRNVFDFRLPDSIFGCGGLDGLLAPVSLPSHKLAKPPCLTVRIGDTPSLHASLHSRGVGDDTIWLPDLRDPGDRSPERWEPPDFFVEAPELMEQPIPPPTLRGLFVVLCEDYRPEVIPLTLWLPVDRFQVYREVQALRLPDVRQHFPRLLEVEPQPCASFAVFLGITGIPGPFCDVVFDCRAIGGHMFAGHADEEATRAELLAIAGFPHHTATEVWVPSFHGPLPDNRPAQLVYGALISLAPRGILPPRFAPLANMLRCPDTWNARAEVPYASDPGVWVLTDEGLSFHAIPSGASRIPRSQLADTLRYDRGLFPQMRNLCIRGVAGSAVLVATQNMPQPLDAEPSFCVVILDLRPLQLGVTWRLAPRGIFSLQQFAEDLDYPCPEGFQLIAEGVVLRVVDGSRVTVACAPIPPADATWPHPHSAQPEGSDAGSSSSEQGADDSDGSPTGDLGGRPLGPPPPLHLRGNTLTQGTTSPSRCCTVSYTPSTPIACSWPPSRSRRCPHPHLSLRLNETC